MRVLHAFDLLLWILGAYCWMAITFWVYERRRGGAPLSRKELRENQARLGWVLAWSAAGFGLALLAAKWLARTV